MIKKRCPTCCSKNITLFGKTSNNKQRFKCLECFKVYIWKDRSSKIFHEKHWFNLWVTDGYSIRQLSYISGHSQEKLHLIKNYWLNQEPPALSKSLIAQAKYILFDGTYFHKNGCLAVFVDIVRKNIIHYAYIERESYYAVYPMLVYLKEQGLNPDIFTLDGHKMVIRAINTVWPEATIQRCLFHIKNQGLMWIRYRPKTEAAWQLKKMLYTITDIKTVSDRDLFIAHFQDWYIKYKNFVQSLPKNSVANKDLKRTSSLIKHALPNMFHFIKDQNIASTTNYLENFYSQIKHQYRNHRGLSEKHKMSFLKWFCYLKNYEK